MAITGTTSICSILSNQQFQTSGLSEFNLSTISITNENDLDVSECFGITTDIISVSATNVTLTGDCDTSLEIQITDGVQRDVDCDFTGFTIQSNGILLFEFSGGTTSDNIHPDCCISLGYVPEIGTGMYYVCRANDVVDPDDCDNYTPNGNFLGNYVVFDFITGGTTTIVPSVECCYQYGYVEEITYGNNPETVDETPQQIIRCVVEQPNPCEGYTVIEPVPLTGPIPFEDPNGGETTIVPSSECCTALGFNFIINGPNSYTCYQNSSNPPTVSFTNDPCCEPSGTGLSTS